MRGKNPIRKPETSDGSELFVKHIFPTLQGEGLFAGWPAVFVRLGGCNLACTFCDTDFEGYAALGVFKIVERVQELAQNNDGKRVRSLVVITGGEPLRQNIFLLCEALLADGFKIQIETNGTLFRELPEGVDIICSPKNTGAGYFPIRADLLPRISALKFIISASDSNYSDVADVGQNVHATPVYVQPMDEYDVTKNAANRALALELAMQHGYRLSLQTHKLLEIE
ncbi:MAG: 7-carboxy-7-deazaguanine synthase QueE [Alphaproteobacteria bacterium]|nr:7-carboxy-7-deazaguanine synthase QueE [Alphaproteobacteria bacterium]